MAKNQVKEKVNANVPEETMAEQKSLKPGSLPYVWKQISRNPGAMIGLTILVLIVTLSLLSPVIFKYNYAKIDMFNQYATPSWEHPFGCDELGRDIMTRVFYGARYTLSIGFASVAISAVLGVILGAVSGFFGGVVDTLIMRFLDIFQAFPQILLAITLSAVFGTGLDKCILSLGISAIPNYARMMRANILTIRGMEYIEAARSIGVGSFTIMFRHILPNCLPSLIVLFTLNIPGSILSESSLSFLGIGAQSPSTSWGLMVSEGKDYLFTNPVIAIAPGVAILVLALAFNFLGDGVRDAMDPYTKQQ